MTSALLLFVALLFFSFIALVAVIGWEE